MRLTDSLHGRTVEDVRRNVDGSVVLYCDSGDPITLEVVNGRIEVRTERLTLDTAPAVEINSTRMRLLEAFLGFTVNYAFYDDDNDLIFVCEPKAHATEKYKKSYGHREIKLGHTNGVIDELPPVSAKIALPSLGLFGAQGK